MTKRHVQHANGVWTYEVTLENEGATIPVLSPSQMEAWIKAVNARLGDVCCEAAQVQREIAVWEVSS